MTKALDAAIRAAEAELNALTEPGTTITLWSLAEKSALAALRAALPAEPTPGAIEAMKIAYIAAIVQPDRWERTYHALRAHLLGEDA